MVPVTGPRPDEVGPADPAHAAPTDPAPAGPPPAEPAGARADLRRVRIAVVGLGGISQSVHLPLLARRWDLFELTALVDLSADRAATLGRRYGVSPARQYRTVAELLAEAGEELDAVLLATSGSHGPELLRLARAGIPVLCEKPVALRPTEVDAVSVEITRQGRDPRTAVLVGYMKEHDPAVARARELLTAARVRAVTVEVLHPADAAQLGFARLLPPPSDVDADTLAALHRATEDAVDAAVGEAVGPAAGARDRAAGGAGAAGAADAQDQASDATDAEVSATVRALYPGVVLGSVIHDIALLRHLLGGITTVDHAEHWGELPGSIQLTGQLAGGARLHLGWHFIPDYPDYRETLTVHHEAGSVQLVFAVPYLLNVATELVVTEAAGPGGGEARTTYRWSQQEAFENELVAFHAMVTRAEPAASGLAEGRADLVTGQLITRALAAG